MRKPEGIYGCADILEAGGPDILLICWSWERGRWQTVTNKRRRITHLKGTQ